MLFAMTGCCATPGGIAAHNRQILRVLARFAHEQGDQLTVFSLLEDTSARPSFLPPSVQFIGFSGSKASFAYSLLAQSVHHPRIIFDHVTLALPLLPLVVLRVVRPVIFAHGSESWRRIRKSSRWLFSGARLVLTNSQFTLRRMQERRVRGRLVACPLGLAPEFALHGRQLPHGGRPPAATQESADQPGKLAFVSASGSSHFLGSRFCLLVGRMHPQEREKGHRELLAVWPEILRDFPEAQLVFAGPGEDRSVLARAACELGVGDSVFLPGAVSHETLTALYDACFAFTMPSRQEGFGLVYLEAMHAAKPCLGCRDDGAEDVIVHGVTGLLVSNPIDMADLSGALRQLLNNPESAHEMGKRGFARLQSEFTAYHVQARLRSHLSLALYGPKNQTE